MKNNYEEAEDIYWDPEEKCWTVSREYALRTKKILKQKAIRRLAREIAAIDRELEQIYAKRSDV